MGNAPNSIENIDNMISDKESKKLYRQYESGLGATMTKTIGTAALQLDTTTAGRVLSIQHKNQPKVVRDLCEDLFVGLAVSCELYNR